MQIAISKTADVILNAVVNATHAHCQRRDHRRVMTEEVVERCRRMLDTGATRQQVADVIGVDVKTIYRYLPASE